MDTRTKECLIVRDFGPVYDLNIDIKPFTLFIGTQGSGKSAISKLLTICRDMDWQLRILNGGDVIAPFRKFCIQEYFKEDTFILYKIGDLEITYENGSFALKFGKLSDEKIRMHLENRILVENAGFLAKMGVVDYNNPEVLKKYNQLLSANARTLLYIPAERNIAGTLSTSLASMVAAEVPIYDALIEYMSVFERAKNLLKNYDIPFLKARFRVDEGKERIDVLSDEGVLLNTLPLLACSSGLQSVLPLIMVIDYALSVKCFDSFVIEEPEQNLFPQNQKELLVYLVSKLNDGISRLFITTHSPYILSCLNIALLAGRLKNNTSLASRVREIVPENYFIDSENIAVYRLGVSADDYCHSLMNEKTGLIGVNELDGVSDSIGEEFDRLYMLFIQTLKK